MFKDLELDEIESIEFLGEENTIDIEIEEPHMFFANDIYTHNSGLNEEVITMSSIAEAYSKTFCADYIFSLSRTFEDKQTNGGRIFIAKNRFGPDGIVLPIYMSAETVTITVFDQKKGLIESLQGSEEQKEKQTAELYQKYKRKKN
jgi:hypothetical protein